MWILRHPHWDIFQVKSDCLQDIFTLPLHKSVWLYMMQHSGRAGQFPLFLSIWNQKGGKRTVIADQGPDCDLPLPFYPEVSYLTAVYLHLGQYEDGIKPNGFTSVYAFAVTMKNSPWVSGQLKLNFVIEFERGGRSHLLCPCVTQPSWIYNLFSLLWRLVFIEKRLQDRWLHSSLRSSFNIISTITITLTSTAFRGLQVFSANARNWDAGR